MLLATWGTALNILVFAALVAAVIYLFVLIVRALKKYIGSKEMREEKQAVKRTLGETLKAHRTRCQMTQEFEAEALGVSRQTVSKWENGSADPSTTNLLALAKLNNAVTAIVNQAVEEAMASGAVSYSDIVTLQTDLSGGITAILTDPIKLNTLRTQLLGDLVEQVDSLDSKDLGIPLGNLTSLIPLSGYGPLLPVRVLAAAAPRASFRNAFQSAGINQTLHQVMLDVSVEVTLLLPGGTTSSVVSAQVCVAETVIVGQVPDAYLQFGGDGILTKE